MSYTTMHKAAIAFAKDSYAIEACRAKEENRDYLRYGAMGANHYHHPDDPPNVKRQYILDGSIAVSYSKPFDDLLKPEKDDPCAFDKLLFISYPYEFQRLYDGLPLPNLQEVKALWKAEKKRCVGHSEDRNNYYRLVGTKDEPSVIVNVCNLIRIMELTNCKGGEYFQYRDSISPIFLHNILDGNEIDGILMPMRVYWHNRCINDD